MIKLKNEINKSATMRELRKEAKKRYEHSWQQELQVEAFMEGAEYLLNLLHLPRVRKRFSSTEQLAEWFHDNYEEVSLKQGWKTQANCQVPFTDLPESNKRTMIEVCQRLLNL